MARSALNVERAYTWGVLRYDRREHKFSYTENVPRQSDPYPNGPVVLNVVVTRRCNMDCQYCVAKDFVGIEEEDLVVSTDMVRWVNRSPFMLLVLTGGEPLMPPYDAVSMRLINSIHGRGVIVDTNGTFMPSRSVLARLKSRNVMVRVSLDSMNPKDEIPVRRVSKEQKYDSRFAYDLKMANIENFVAAGVKTAVQTVVWQSNKEHLYQIIDWLEEKGIKRWYLQRLIPSYKFKDRRIGRVLKPEDYYPLANDLASRASLKGVECVAKMDMRHNSVYLLTTDGVLYTQGPIPGQKVRLGTIHKGIEYFDYVSAADHAWRYYLSDVAWEKQHSDLG